MEQQGADYRTVAVFGSVLDAEQARDVLESDGIVAAVLGGLELVPRPDALAVRLLVPARDLARARDLLAPERPPDVGPEPSAPPPPLDPTWTVGWLALLVAAGVALLAAYAL